jgi:hypothetical protein
VVAEPLVGKRDEIVQTLVIPFPVKMRHVLSEDISQGGLPEENQFKAGGEFTVPVVNQIAR